VVASADTPARGAAPRNAGAGRPHCPRKSFAEHLATDQRQLHVQGRANIGFSSSNATRSGQPGTPPVAHSVKTPHPPAAPSNPEPPIPATPPKRNTVGGKGLAARDTARSGGVRRPLELWAAARIRVLLPGAPQVTFRAWPLPHTCPAGV